MLGHLALDEKDGLLRVQTHGQKPGVGFLGVPSELRWHLPDRQGVQVRKGIYALVALVLELDVVSKGPKIVAQGKGARALVHT